MFNFPKFTWYEKGLWLGSIGSIMIAAILCKQENNLILFASIIGVTSLIFNAKGHPIGQLLMILFSLSYGIISYSFSYYGEMITYLGMTAPIALVALIEWIKHPSSENASEVKVEILSRKESGMLLGLGALVTFAFYFLLKAFHTNNLFLSTVSIFTSFVAAAYTVKRSSNFALWYALNDLVLIGLWILATLSDPSYLSVVLCFSVFLVNDLYGFIHWKKMEQQQGGTYEQSHA